MYDLLSCSAEDRAAGEYHRAPVLHVPSNIVYLINDVMRNIDIVPVMGTSAILCVTRLRHV